MVGVPDGNLATVYLFKKQYETRPRTGSHWYKWGRAPEHLNAIYDGLDDLEGSPSKENGNGADDFLSHNGWPSPGFPVKGLQGCPAGVVCEKLILFLPRKNQKAIG